MQYKFGADAQGNARLKSSLDDWHATLPCNTFLYSCAQYEMSPHLHLG